MNCVKEKVQEVSIMKEDRQEKLKISNDLLDAMLEDAILSLYAKGMTVRDIQAT